MDPVTIGMISMGIGGAVKVAGGLLDHSADIMRQQAQLKLDTLEQNMRRTEGSQTQLLSSTKARMAGTGFADDSGSFTGYLKTMSTEFELQNKATGEMGQKSIDLMRQAADTADTAKWLGIGSDLLGTGASLGKLSAGIA